MNLSLPLRPFAAFTKSPILRVSAVILSCVFSAGLAGAASSESEVDWQRFRGPNGLGTASSGDLPTEFGPETNVAWKTRVPRGYSSPIVSGDRIYLTGYEDDRLLVFALDLETGHEVWRRTAPRTRTATLDPRNDPASPSVVTDGEVVIAFFGDFGVIAYSPEGQQLWEQPLGPFTNLYGVGASPILLGDRVILAVDQQQGSFLLSLDKQNGELQWSTERPEAKTGHSTPVIWQPEGGEPQIVLPGSFYLTAFDPNTGEKLWWVDGLSFEMKSVPVIEDGVLFINGYGSQFNEPGQVIELPEWQQAKQEFDANADGVLDKAECLKHEVAKQWFGFNDLDQSGGLDEAEWLYFKGALASRNNIMAVRLPGGSARGDLTASHRIWQYFEKVPQLPSPLVYQDVLYMVDDRGITTTLKPATGEVIAQGRLEGAVDSFYASPVGADDKVFLASRSGTVVVLPPGGQLKPLAVNDLDEQIQATPAIAQDQLIIRTRDHLYAFSSTASDAEDGKQPKP